MGDGNQKVYPILTKMQIRQKERDKIRTKELLDKGYNVWRIWENQIRVMNLRDFAKNLLFLYNPFDKEEIKTKTTNQKNFGKYPSLDNHDFII